MLDNSADVPQGAALPRRYGRLSPRQWLDSAILRLCSRLIEPSAIGRLQLTLPSGASQLIEGTEPGIDAQLTLHSYDVFWRSLRSGSIGFAESVIAGHLHSDDLVALFGYFIGNRETLRGAGHGKFRVRTRERAYHQSRANTRDGSRANIAAHYDLGNAFYKLWLDSSLTYSSGLFVDPDMSLEAAQQAKYDLVLDALDLAPGHRLLEIGCGWGAFAARAVERGAEVTGLTLSREQLAEAQTLLRRLGLEAYSQIRLEDYRDTQGTYDRIASIEMIEAVGEENWPQYFQAIRDRLAPGGLAVIQAITIDERLFEGYRRKADFIQRYIFPGGMLPTRQLMQHHANAAGLEFETVHTFGASYARTLAEWRQRFHAGWPCIVALGFDERFRQMWDYYFAYCEAGFARGTVDVGIYRLRKRDAANWNERPLEARSE
jgi:cyclopropane-fatty-acyl-phospholipid synthase